MLKYHTFMITLLITLISACGVDDQDVPNYLKQTSRHHTRRNNLVEKIQTNNAFLHFKNVADILKFEEADVMLISQKYYPNICFGKDKRGCYLFSVSQGADFTYELVNDVIKIYYLKNEIFKGITEPIEGSLFAEVSLINDSTFHLNYIQKEWIQQINKDMGKGTQPWFPSIFHGIDP